MATFVLVPGAMYPAWVWHKVVPLLEAQRHSVIAPDLPGTGENRAIDPRAATLEIWATYLADIARSAAAPVILVGHSRGGHVIGDAAERATEHIAGLVYVTAALSTPGQTLFETISVGDGPCVTPPESGAHKVSDEYARDQLFDRCEPELAAEAVRRMFPEPVIPAKTASSVTWARWGRIHRTYIECSADKSLPLACQRAMQAKAPCNLVLSIDTDHSPFLSAPSALASALLETEAELRKFVPRISPTP